VPFEKAVFAGGHFWYMQEVFEKLPGVKEVIAGYTGGNTKNPTHEQVLSGATGHYEAVMVIYDSKKIPYKKCLNVFWKNIDPTDYRGQFADRGTQYRTAIFYLNKEQKRLAFKSKEEIEKSDIFLEPIATEILKASPFYPAEEYHQGYYKKCPMRYRTYKFHSGRGKLLKKLWKKR
jgi:methionine-S-sulfoxide reductase